MSFLLLLLILHLFLGFITPAAAAVAHNQPHPALLVVPLYNTERQLSFLAESAVVTECLNFPPAFEYWKCKNTFC
jgi:hypothetical protein